MKGGAAWLLESTLLPRCFGGRESAPDAASTSSVRTPSPDLLDTIYAVERRQDWYRDYAEAHGLERVGLVGSFTTDQDPVEAAAQLRDVLGFGLARRVDF